MGNTIGKKGKDKHSRKRELEVLVLLTGKGDAGKKDLSGRRTGVSEGLPGAAEFQSMAKSLGLAADATMADLNPSQMPSLDDVVHMADTGDVENAFITLQDRLLMFPDDVDSMTHLARLCVIREKFNMAELWFQRAITHSPKHTKAMMYYGSFLSSHIRNDKLAAMVLSRALEYLTPKDPDYKQMKMLQMQAMKRGGLNEKEVKASLGDGADKVEITDREYRLMQVKWCGRGMMHTDETEDQGQPRLTSIDQAAPSLTVVRSMYELNYAEAMAAAERTLLEAPVSVYTGVAPEVTRRGKADRLICNARGVVGHNEAPVVKHQGKKVWPREWYVCDSVVRHHADESTAHVPGSPLAVRGGATPRGHGGTPRGAAGGGSATPHGDTAVSKHGSTKDVSPMPSVRGEKGAASPSRGLVVPVTASSSSSRLLQLPEVSGGGSSSWKLQGQAVVVQTPPEDASKHESEGHGGVGGRSGTPAGGSPGKSVRKMLHLPGHKKRQQRRQAAKDLGVAPAPSIEDLTLDERASLQIIQRKNGEGSDSLSTLAPSGAYQDVERHFSKLYTRAH
mmetsp:Transcript_50283/g.114448  ORF Transcript_50283/g.114448 Transcript_50283/m.114448 type:complete len:563 (-) Transcript_50283:127-1815(-)